MQLLISFYHENDNAGLIFQNMKAHLGLAFLSLITKMEVRIKELCSLRNVNAQESLLILLP